MASGPLKPPVGDVVRAPATNRAAPAADAARAPAPAHAAPSTLLTPASSASIAAHAQGESATGAGVLPQIRAAAGHGGQALGADARARFGGALGADLDAVRIHTGALAAQAADALDARAFTLGNDIVFGANEYAPGSERGEQLLAHELTHVVQPEAPRTQAISRQDDASEREADSAAQALLQGDTVRPQAASSAAVQRQPKTDAPDPPTSLLDRLFDKASPFLAASVGSTRIANFDTGKSDLKPAHLKELEKTAHNITQLLKQYPQSTVQVIGHTDTVGTEENNLTLGQARADATADALGKFGVPNAILRTRSVGEAPPQAVKTKDETPNANNRRVEVRFEPKADIQILPPPKIEPATPKKDPAPAVTPTPTPQFDFNYHGDPDKKRGPPYRQDDSNPDWFKDLPPPIKGTEPQSMIDVIGKAVIDPVVDAVAGKLSKETRAKIKQAARDGVVKGSAKAARSTAEAAGVKDPAALDAIEKATEAAIQQKGGKPP